MLAAGLALTAPAVAAQEADPIGDALREAVIPTPAAPEPQAAPAESVEPIASEAPQATAPIVSAPAVASPPPAAAPTPAVPTAAPAKSPAADDSEEAEDALPTGPVPYTPQITPPRAPAPYRPSRSESYTYEGYDARLRSSFANAQGLLGVLDGGWTVVDASGRRLFAFQLVERSAGGMLEGVWRDLRRTPTPTSSGLIGTIQRTGGQLTVTFAASRGGFTTLALAQSIDGSWGGRLTEPDGESAVSMRRGD